MFDRRTFLLAAAASFLALPAEAGLRDRIRERLGKKLDERKAQDRRAQSDTLIKPLTRSYGPALLDIHAPAGAVGLPVMIYVHGGGWRHGDRTYVQAKPNLFAQAGYVFVSIDYRMLPQFGVASQARDVEKAYAWVRGNIARFGGNPERMAVMGHSAGCHLVALAGLRGGLPGAKALFFDDVEAYDIEALAKSGHMRRIYGNAFDDPSQWHDLSPMTYASRGGHPPILIAYSRVKGHREASAAIADRLKAAGDTVEIFDGSAYSHGEINRGIGASATAMTDALMAFLARHMA